MEPLVLEGAFAAILALNGLDEVVQFESATHAERGSHYDAAIVTPAYNDRARAHVVITLPDTNGTADSRDGPRRGQVRTGTASSDVDIHDQREVIRLLDLHAPAGASRRGRLLTAQGHLAC